MFVHRSTRHRTIHPLLCLTSGVANACVDVPCFLPATTTTTTTKRTSTSLHKIRPTAQDANIYWNYRLQLTLNDDAMRTCWTTVIAGCTSGDMCVKGHSIAYHLSYCSQTQKDLPRPQLSFTHASLTIYIYVCEIVDETHYSLGSRHLGTLISENFCWAR